jgi:hypothetical protein
VTTRDWVRTEIYEKGLGIVDVEKWELDELWQERSDAYKANRVLADAVSFEHLYSPLFEDSMSYRKLISLHNLL